MDSISPSPSFSSSTKDAEATMADAKATVAPKSDSLHQRQKPEQDDTNDRQAPSISLVKSHVQTPESVLGESIFVILICCAQLMTQAGIGMALYSANILGASWNLQDEPGQLSWFMAAYALTVGTFILPAGRLGDLFGHKMLFVAGFLWYGLWQILAGFSVYTTFKFFDVCRGLMGIGPAFMLPNALAILGRTYEPGPKKDFVFSLFGATAPTGSVVAGIFTSLIAMDAWWPWAFWVAGIVCFIFGILGIFFIPHTPSPKFPNDGISMWERIDTLGTISGVSGLVLFNFTWNQAPVAGWETVYVYVILILGVLCIALFFYIESRAKFPLIPFEVLNKNTGFVLGCICAGWSSFSVWFWYLVQFLLFLRRESALMVAVHTVPVTISGLGAAMTTGYLLSRVPPSVIMMIAMFAFAIGIILVVTTPIHQTYWAQTFVTTLVMPWGMDMSFPAATILLSNAMPKEHQGIAASLVSTVVNYSISIALGIAGTIEIHLNRGGSDMVRGYRAAMWFGVGMAGAGLVLAAFFVVHQVGERKLARAKGAEEIGEGSGGGEKE